MQVVVMAAMLGGASLNTAYAQSTPTNTALAKQSLGLRVPIQSIIRTGRAIIVQVLLENTTKGTQYVVLYGGARATSDTGAIGALRDVAGVAKCSPNQNQDVFALEACRKTVGNGTDHYTAVAPGEFIVASMEWDFGEPAKELQTINFSILGLVRSSPPADDPLKPTTPGPAQVVTLNFPLSPVPRR